MFSQVRSVSKKHQLMKVVVQLYNKNTVQWN